MTNDTLANFIYTWVNQIVNTEAAAGITIIFSHQNAPAPDMPYMVISQVVNRNSNGRPTVGSPITTGADASKSKMVQDYNASLELREVGGNGDYLRLLKDSVERTDIQALFTTNNVVFISSGEIQSVPRLDEEDWVIETVMDIEVAYGELTYDTTSYVDTVEYTGDVEGIDV